jgi:hypothetical protein
MRHLSFPQAAAWRSGPVEVVDGTPLPGGVATGSSEVARDKRDKGNA